MFMVASNLARKQATLTATLAGAHQLAGVLATAWVCTRATCPPPPTGHPRRRPGRAGRRHRCVSGADCHATQPGRRQRRVQRVHAQRHHYWAVSRARVRLCCLSCPAFISTPTCTLKHTPAPTPNQPAGARCTSTLATRSLPPFLRRCVHVHPHARVRPACDGRRCINHTLVMLHASVRNRALTHDIAPHQVHKYGVHPKPVIFPST